MSAFGQNPNNIPYGSNQPQQDNTSNFYPPTAQSHQLDEQTLNTLLYEEGLVSTFGDQTNMMQQTQRSASPAAQNQPMHSQMTSSYSAATYPPPMTRADGSQNQFSYPYNSPVMDQYMMPTQDSMQASQSQMQPQAFEMNQRPTALSLQVPSFGSSFHSQDEQHMTPNQLVDMPQPPHLLSPIIRIENPEEFHNQSNMVSRSQSVRSQASRISHHHLSPYGNDDYSDDGVMSHHSANGSTTAFPNFSSPHRNDDGSWIKSEGGHGGLSPIDRASIFEDEIPSINDLEKERTVYSRHAGVHQWLTHSSAGSEDENKQPRRSRSKKNINRPRARSANDLAAMRANKPGVGYLAVPGPPGPGLYLNEASDFGDEEDDASGSPSESSTPPIDPQAVQSYLQQPQQPNGIIFRGHPWTDEPLPADQSNDIHQPMTANAAMMVYQEKCEEPDNYSLAATIGSRRRGSQSDMSSAFGDISRRNTGIAGHEASVIPREKKGLLNILTNGIPSRTNSRKRRSDADSTIQAIPDARSPQAANRRSIGTVSKLNTDAQGSMGGRSPGLSTNLSPMLPKVRHRSKSDIGKLPKSPGLGNHLTQQGGPSEATLNRQTKPQSRISRIYRDEDESDEDDAQEGVTMDLAPRLDLEWLPIPNTDGFRYQILTLNPNINGLLLGRLTEEQDKRFKRLLDARREHARNVKVGKCSDHCPSLGGLPVEIPLKPPKGNPDANTMIFRVVPKDKLDQEIEQNIDNHADSTAQFPIGIPTPPTHILPSKFECSFCFKLKEFRKPSDWTKHVHEDLSPFTCTFPECSEPKSFKRKADWVRHENERHRQLEKWTCDYHGCIHVCFRRDNFVQHLVREHKVPEPKIRAPRQGTRSPHPLTPDKTPELPPDFDPLSDTVESYVQRIVDRCYQPSEKRAQDEPCRFCGNICTSWKKLTVHLGKHMEQIALPMIPLIERLSVTAQSLPPSYMTSAQAIPTGVQPMILSNHLSASPDQGFFNEPGEMGPDLSIPNLPLNTANAYLGGQQLQQNFLDPSYGMATASYPPALMPGTRSRAASSVGSQDITYQGMLRQQGTTYPPTSYDAQGGAGQGSVYYHPGMSYGS
jgi:hypothetical protein